MIMSSAGCALEELKVSCLNQWIPGRQKRSEMTLEENMEVSMSLRKKTLNGPLLKNGLQ